MSEPQHPQHPGQSGPVVPYPAQPAGQGYFPPAPPRPGTIAPVFPPAPPVMAPGAPGMAGMPQGFAPAPPAFQPRVRAGRWRLVTVSTVLAVLTALGGWQMLRISQLSDRLAGAEQQIAAERESAKAAAETMASRVASLEKAAFHPDQIAAAALPSVFRVKAGGASGTAWAVGKPTASGGTYLFTNFHVVEMVWEKGERKVGIEHRDLRFDATIVKVDKEKDVAQLETAAAFPGLTVATEVVRPGEPIVVVGAPLGLESSVTTGVVSAFRKIEGTDETYVQFDAPINPGNSGGPVINGRGQVVGIATAKIRNAEGIGLAVPISIACDAIPICG